jgi:type VI secretion system secreted protein VgrG
LGVAPGTAITGFLGTSENDGPGTFVGVAYQGESVALQAQADAVAAYVHLAGLAYTRNLTGLDLGGTSLAPGVYHFDSSAQLTGKLTLDGAGLYVFQIGSTLTTTAASSIEALNGANPSSQVFWQIGSSATFGADTIFGGTVIALASNTLGARTRVDGRIMALTGGVTLDNNQIVVPEISSVWMFALAGLAAMAFRNAHRQTRASTVR